VGGEKGKESMDQRKRNSHNFCDWREKKKKKVPPPPINYFRRGRKEEGGKKIRSLPTRKEGKKRGRGTAPFFNSFFEKRKKREKWIRERDRSPTISIT